MSSASQDDFLVSGKPISELKVVELRKELEVRNLPKSGNKKELSERLKTYMINNNENESTIETSPLVFIFIRLINPRKILYLKKISFF